MLACTWLPNMFSRCAGLYWKNSIYALRLRPVWTISSQILYSYRWGLLWLGWPYPIFFGSVVGLLGQSSSNHATVVLRHGESTGARWLQLLHTRACMSIYEHEYAEPRATTRCFQRWCLWLKLTDGHNMPWLMINITGYNVIWCLECCPNGPGVRPCVLLPICWWNGTNPIIAGKLLTVQPALERRDVFR